MQSHNHIIEFLWFSFCNKDNNRIQMRNLNKIIMTVLVMLMISGCGSVELQSRKLIDYRHNEQYVETYTSLENKYNLMGDSWQYVPITKTKHVPESYELLWEYTYSDGRTRRNWEPCTRFEYDAAKKGLDHNTGVN